MRMQENKWGRLQISVVVAISVLFGIGGLIGFSNKITTNHSAQAGASVMVVPSSTPTFSASTWADIQNAVPAAPTGNVLIEITTDITADSGAIIIPTGRNVFLRSNPSSSNIYSIYQDIWLERHFIVNSGELSIGNITLTRTTPAGSWFESGGVAVQNSGNLEMFIGSVVSGNEAEYGGGIYVDNGTFGMQGGIIIGNTTLTHSGGGVYVNAGSFTMVGGKINDNTSYEMGGGIYITENSTFIMQGGTIGGNIAKTMGGGGVAISASNFTMSGGTISNNIALSTHGGGIYNIFGNITILGGKIINNTAMWNNGGGIYNYWGSSLNILGGAIINNSAHAFGGGIFTISYDDLTIGPDVIFIGNTASSSHDWYLSPSFQADSLNVPWWESGWAMGGNIANIEWHSVSIAGAHLLNNYDINFNGASISYQVVTFNPNGGSFVPTDFSHFQADGQSQWRWISQVADTGVTDPLPTYSLAFNANGNLFNLFLSHPIRHGYVFGGWFDTQENANGTTEEGRVLSADDITIEGSRTLYARWIEKVIDGGNTVPDAPNSGVDMTRVTTNVVSIILVLSLLLSLTMGFKLIRD